ncbi:Chromobox -like protein 5 [Echinococcus granulosus]|uniref:Heterochromatin protein 1 n=1 Tax=Echinococcus granulosus TaxID=6210 RepID=U6J683_ECHGR|nr:Chromobox protein [Echinococcus granulosus]EUB64111.1 Chromobox protein [Echinococcus granulosus]KAH9280213.1 Chromobox -like protein 5 [Echinococcus granulosus]CDS19599.1 chromobox protein 1 [Echinococcus granulosus]
MSDFEENPDEFTVEKVLRVRIRNGKKEYFLKWKGYPDSENTWEPEENLDCPDLIKQFEDNAKKLAKPRPAGRPSSIASSDNGSVRDAEIPKHDSLPPSEQDSSKTGDTAPKKRGRKRRNPTSQESDANKTGDEHEEEEEEGEDEEEGEGSSPAKRQVLSELPSVGGKVRGFERNLKVERIIGATESSGELMFLIKWQGIDIADLVPAKEANVKCPQAVIKFYEERLTWHTPDSQSSPART